MLAVHVDQKVILTRVLLAITRLTLIQVCALGKDPVLLPRALYPTLGTAMVHFVPNAQLGVIVLAG